MLAGASKYQFKKSQLSGQWSLNQKPSNSNLSVLSSQATTSNIKANTVFDKKHFYGKGMQKTCNKNQFHVPFQFGKQPKTTIACMRFLKKVIFKRDHEKGNLIFSFAPSDILRRKFWKAKMLGTSYRSLELQDMLTKREGEK